MVRAKTWSSAVLFALCSSACGGSQPPPASAEAEPGSAETAGALPEEPAPAPAVAPEQEPATPSEAKPQAAQPDTTPREVRYIQSSDGLKVEVSGVRFFVSASTVKQAAGFAVQVNVKAESMDGKPHSLLSTESGPLALAGSVTRKGQTTSFGDERKGEAEQTIAPGAPLEFSRTWPKKGERLLANGDSVELDVGLWGVGDDAETRRPLRALARVKGKVEAWKGRATAEPPPNVGK